ncbi:ABC transporter ATP-binding protein [Pseudahrensia aquimaris]|uniref:ABC transporter ATP-binding protein n=1 Tax=Pseudahrensia aquimaris TaxID=744461 RepID=A0ABW3FAA4_9HYPH
MQLKSVDKAFGAVVIAKGLDLTVQASEGLGIIGPNGAGKSTLFNLITGDQHINGGSITFGGREVSKDKPFKRCRQGIGRSYQIPHPFGKMTVYENILTAAVFGSGKGEAEASPHVIEVLHLTGLAKEANKPAGHLTLLQRKRLELARGLATDPKLLLLDEIAGGLTEHEVQSLIGTIRDIRKTGIALIWIEHIVHALLATVDRLIVLNGGELLADGEPEAVMKSPQVQKIYMGVEPA